MSERLRGLIKHYVVPPIFDDEAKTRIAGLLNTILLVLMAVAVTYSAIAPIVDPSPAIALVVNGMMVLLYLGLLRLIRLGRVELAGLLLSSGVWVLVTLAAIAYGGVLTPGLFSYFSTILIAGLLLGRRAALGFVGLSILASLGLLYADLRQILPPPIFPTTPFTMWWMAVMNFIMAGVLLNWTVHSLNQALERARRNECDLAQSNHNLQREIAERKQAEEALRQSEEAARQFQEQLKALHAVSIALSRADSFDELCRWAVELGRSQLGFDRLGLWFLDDDPHFMVGTFGTSEGGQLRDERGKRLPLDSVSEAIEALSNKSSLKLHDNAPLYDDNHQVIGRGWRAMAAIWDGDKIIGLLSTDNLLQRQPASDYQLELLRLYGATLGHLGLRKRAEEALKAYAEQLEEMVEERTRALHAAQEKLIRQEKLAVLGQLAGGVGHELRNPLGVISNAVYFLQMVLPEADETIKEYLAIIAGRVHEAERIMSGLLNLSRIKPAQREEVAVSALVTEVLARHPPPEAVTVTTHLPADLSPVLVDPQQIEQVLANLVTNAYQAMPDGGELSIRAEGNEKQIHLSLTDTGCGMSPETMAKIFEPLFTTKARGIGLGLSVSKNLVEVNGGSIAAESTESQGSAFTVTLVAA